MIPREPIEVARLLGSGRWNRKHAEAYRTQFGDEALFNALLQPFTQTAHGSNLSSYGCQQAAAILFLDLMPQCRLALQDAISQSLSVWNLSVEQWPFYLCRQFGIEPVEAAIANIALYPHLTDTERRALDTFRYWLRAKPDMIFGNAAEDSAGI